MPLTPADALSAVQEIAPRFVVLRHEVGSGLGRTQESHYDWLFECDERLRCWATSDAPDWVRPFETKATQLADHRPVYLDFEGDIGKGRGAVYAIRRGTYRLQSANSDHFRVALTWQHGSDLVDASVSFQRTRDGDRLDPDRDAWRLCFRPGRYETKR